jgi:immune inhibitor A
MQAARALSEPFTIQQPDGSWLTLTCYGDEHANWLTTDDGVLVAYRQGAYYVAAIEDNGKLTCSNLLAHSHDLRQETERQLCKVQLQRQSRFYAQASQSMEKGRRAQVTSTSYFPHKDQPKSLVILVNFQDVKFTSADPVKQFEQYFNGDTQENLGQNEDKNLVGVKKYFEQCSHEQFSPQFTIVGPVTLSENMEYYGKSDEGSSSDAHFDEFCKESIAMVDDEVNFADYDNDGDGCAELVCLIFAGYGQSNNSGLPNTIWPKCGYKGIDTKDGVKINYVNCNAELRKYYDPETDPEHAKSNSDINGIGVFVHEFSHGMGLPDMYATNENARINNQTPEFWDLMDYGEYANNGYAPVVYSAWEQEAMGWITAEQLTEPQTISDMQPLVRGGKAYKFGNGGDAEEWIYLENVQNYDKENHVIGHVYSHGLLVWHIAYGRSTVNMTDYPNNTPSQPRVCIVPADGEVINGYLFGTGKPYTQAEYINSLRHDAFPYTYQKDEQDVTINSLTAEQQLPNYKFYKSATGETTTEDPVFSLTDITEDSTNGTVSFFFNDGSATAISEVSTKNAESCHMFFDLQGRPISGTPTQHGIYIIQGKKVVR